MKPLIHILYEVMEELLCRTMTKFVNSEHLSNQIEDGTTRKTPAIELLELDVYNKIKMKPIKMVDIETQIKRLLLGRSILERLLKLYEINNRRSSKETIIKIFLSKLLLHSVAEKE